MKEAYLPQKLPDAYGNLDYSYFYEELIDASKMDNHGFQDHGQQKLYDVRVKKLQKCIRARKLKMA